VHPKISTGRVAIYARYSSDRQSETSIEDQVRRARDVIDRAGGDPDKALVFPDFAISGSSMQRPGLEELLRAVDAKKVDVILTEDVSRISRDMADSAQIFKKLQFAGVPLMSISDGIDTSQKHAKLNFALKGMLAELAIDEIRDKTLRGLEGRHLAGLATGNVAYGYRTAVRVDERGRSVGSEIVIDEAAAKVVRRIFRMYADGAALHHIARTLIRDGVPSARTRTRHTVFGWGPAGISQMLRQEKYIGTWRFKERQWVKVPGTNRRIPRMRPPEEVMTADRQDLRIVDDELWNEVQARLATRAGKGRGTRDSAMSSRKSRYLMSGIVVCDECGKPLTIYGANTTYYRCQTHHAKGSCSNDMRVREDLLRETCIDAIQEELWVPENIEYIKVQVADRIANWAQGVDNEMALLRERLARGGARAKELVEFVASGQRSTNIGAELQQIEARIEADRATLKRLEAEAKNERPDMPDPEAITAAVFKLHELLPKDLDRARHALTRWFKDGQIRVQKEPAGFAIEGVFYPLLMLKDGRAKNTNKKPKDYQSLGGGLSTFSSGGCPGTFIYRSSQVFSATPTPPEDTASAMISAPRFRGSNCSGRFFGDDRERPRDQSRVPRVSQRGVHGPRAFHVFSNFSAMHPAATGSKNSASAVATSPSRSGAWASLPRRTNARHCASAVGLSVNAGESATGAGSIAVLRLRKVEVTARASTAPSKSSFRAMSQMSKKSFMRLFSVPSLTIASNFSATTVSRG
jgi:DNA invertase Pin-like site-specific DNA recombinase